MLTVNTKQFVATIMVFAYFNISNVEAKEYMGPLDMQDWSLGPRCVEIDDNDSTQIKRIQCSEANIRLFDSHSIIPNAFGNSKFDQIEKLYSKWIKQNAIYADGISKISVLCDALERSIRSEIQSSLSQIRKWQTNSNSSFLSRYAEAVYWRAAAWSARGGGYANAVKKEGWVLFGERLKKSYDVLEEIKNESVTNPAWYPMMINVMIEMGAPLAETRKVFLEGVSRFPEYHSTYFAMGRAYSPLWGGDYKSFDAFVNEAVKLTNGFESNAFYARLYWTVDQENNIPFLDESGYFPNWEKLKISYADLMKKYPDSQWNKNRFVEVACRSSDSRLYRQLRREIEGKFIDDMFGPGARDTCDLKHSWK